MSSVFLRWIFLCTSRSYAGGPSQGSNGGYYYTRSTAVSGGLRLHGSGDVSRMIASSRPERRTGCVCVPTRHAKCASPVADSVVIDLRRDDRLVFGCGHLRGRPRRLGLVLADSCPRSARHRLVDHLVLVLDHEPAPIRTPTVQTMIDESTRQVGAPPRGTRH